MWSQDFKEFVGLLNAHQVEYLVVGGYAVALHGHPRFTGDLDVWVNPNAGNAARLLKVLDEFGFGGFHLKIEDFTTEGRVLQMGHPPFRIDLLTTVDGVRFGDCWPGRVTVQYEDQLVHFIGLEDLRKNKKAVGRPKDLDDLSNLGPADSN
jgi:hypothetical protein